MSEAEKIAKAFEHCISDNCNGCPFYFIRKKMGGCKALSDTGYANIPKDLLRDYIGLLKNKQS